MPAPDIYHTGDVTPFSDKNIIEDIPYEGIFYATDREPSVKPDEYYKNERGLTLRLGKAEIRAGVKNMTWDQLKKISLLKDRPIDYPLKIYKVTELGTLNADRAGSDIAPYSKKPVENGAQTFADKINDKLAVSRQKDLYIYVHGYKVGFENPLLVSSELWHFMGYEGAFIAYAWPSTPSRWAYGSDLETASLSAGNLRDLIAFLAERTKVQKIHIIGYSAGTRVVCRALHQIALMHFDRDSGRPRKDFRLGHIILIGSDMDQELFGSYIRDGIDDMTDDVILYISQKDRALGVSRWLFGRERLGQLWPDVPDQRIVKFLRKNKKLIPINVTDAEGSLAGNGHGYFRDSPWVSSDILATLIFNFKPVQRGLVRMKNIPIWTFPEDYTSRLINTLQGVTH